MRKFWFVAASASTLVVVLGVGVWTGAVYHDRLELALQSPGHREAEMASSTPMSPQLKSSPDHPNSSGKQLYHCGMHPWIIQDHPGNCPICHMELTPIQGGQVQTAQVEKKILYYWDPMLGASSISATPGKSVMGMDLIPVYNDQISGGPAIIIDPTVVQNMGVQTAAVKKGSLIKSLRTVGYLEVPETGLYDITVKVNGYIQKLYANKTGMHIHKDDPLFELYSPDLVVAEEELIAAKKSVEALSSASEEVRTPAQTLVESARRKLQLLDIPDNEIDAIAKVDHATKTVTFRSPTEGHLEDKMIVEGAAVQPGMKLMRIEDHKKLWLEAQVYEGQLPLVKVGEMAEASLDALPGQTVSGKIIFISPHLDHMTRTVDVRIELDNPGLMLKPGMYATVQIHVEPIEDALIVPRESVIDTGTRKIIFVQEAEGHFSPRMVITGLSGDNDQMQILSGVAPGEVVVTSGQFLMDVESRTQEAIQKLQMSDTPTTMAIPGSKESETPPAMMPTATMVASGKTDDVVKAYLTVAEYLQTQSGKPVDVSELVASSSKLSEMSMDDEQRFAKTLQQAASAMKDQSLEQQQKSFEKVGAAIVPLIDKDPPSAMVAPKLYIVNCPMEKADWLQTKAEVSNPFLPMMRTCGSVTRTLSLSPVK